MPDARTALPLAARSLVLCLLIPGCGGHPPAPTPTQQAHGTLSAGTSPAPAPVPEASSNVLAAPAPVTAPAPITPPRPPPPPAGWAPLSEAQRATLRAGDEDELLPTPIHYMKSNEVRHDVWFPYVKDLGGAYLGVGSDQNYTLAAAARSELVFLSDIDRSVVDLHRVYEVLVEASDTPEQLLARFEADAVAASKALLEAGLTGESESDRKRIIRLYAAARETVLIHLKRVIRRHQGDVPTTWMSDPKMYDHVRALFKADRVRAMGGDLTGARSLQTAAAAGRALGVPFRVVYLSNAEEYFNYDKQFVANVEAFVGDERTLLLRTIYNKAWVHADQLWAYQVQPWTDFKRRLGERKNRSRNPMLRYAELDGTLVRETGTKGLSLINLPVAGG